MNIVLLMLFITVCVSIFIVFQKRNNFEQLTLFITSGTERLSLYLSGVTVTPLLIFGSFFSCYSLLVEWNNNKLKNIPRVYFIICGGVLLSCLLSTVTSNYKLISLKASLYYLLYLLLFIGEYLAIRKAKEFREIIISILIGVGVFVAFGYIQEIRFLFNLYPDLISFTTHFNNALSPLDFIDKVGSFTLLRPNSGFNDVNTAAGFLILYIPILLFAFFISKGSALWKRSILFSLSLFSLLLLILMHSRSTLIAVFILLLLVIGTFVWQSKQSRKLLVSLLCAFFIILMVCLGLFHTQITQFGQKIYTSEYSAQAHVFYSQAAMQEFSLHPFFGGGVGSFTRFYQDQMALGKVPYAASVDNPPLFLKLLAENGIVGCIAFSSFILLPFFKIKAFMTRTLSEKNKKFIICLSVGYIGLFTANFLHAYFFLFFSAIFLGLYLGVLDSTKKE